MIRLSQDRAKTLLAIHGWSGVLLGLLLYTVIVTGMISVFADEIGDWSSPTRQPPTMAFPTGLDAKLRELAATVDAKYHEELSLFPRAGGRIQAFFHHHVAAEGGGLPEEQGVEFTLDPRTLAVLERREGLADDLHSFDIDNALADFLVELHVSLHIPEPWGYFVTGILGLAMMVAATTGLLVHRHLLKELFTIRRLREALLQRRDAHVIAATWTLPFAFILAFTGSFYSFTSSVGVPVMAMVAFGGDQTALFETVVGLPPPENTTLTAPADFDAMFADARARTRTEPAFAAITHFGRADARLTVFTYPGEGKLFNHNLMYDAASGAFLREKPSLGLVPSIGGTAADLMGPLHFGNFAGVLSKSVWFVLGFASCYVALTGMLLWTARRAQSLVWRRMERVVTWMGFGLPLSLALVPHGYFFGRAAGSAELEMPMALALFGGAMTATVSAVAISDLMRLRRWLLAFTGLALVLTPVARSLAGGLGWFEGFQLGSIEVPALDICFILGGGVCLRAASRSRPAASVERTRVPDEESEVTA